MASFRWILLCTALLFLGGCGNGGSETPNNKIVSLEINKTSNQLSLMNTHGLNIGSYQVKITGLTTSAQSYNISIRLGDREFTVINNTCRALHANNHCTFQVRYTGNSTKQAVATIHATSTNGVLPSKTVILYALQDPFNADTTAYTGGQLALLNNQADVWITDNLGNPSLPMGNRFFSIGRTTSPAINAWIDNRPLPSRGNQMFFPYNAPYIQPYDTEQKQLLTSLIIKKSCGNKQIYFVAQPVQSPVQPPVNVNIKYHSIYADGLLTGVTGRPVNLFGNIRYSINGGAYQNSQITINAHDGVWSPPAPHLADISALLIQDANSYLVAIFTNQTHIPNVVISVSSLVSNAYMLNLVNYLQNNQNLRNISSEITLNDRFFQDSVTQYRTQLTHFCEITA